MKKINLILLLSSIFSLSVVRSAQAYIDPGAGSFLFQLVIAGALGGLFFIKSIIRSIKLRLSNIFGGKKAESTKEVEKNDQQ